MTRFSRPNRSIHPARERHARVAFSLSVVAATLCPQALGRRFVYVIRAEKESPHFNFLFTPPVSGRNVRFAFPLISGSGCFWGVVSTHIREPRSESDAERSLLAELALRVANGLERHARSCAARKRDGDADHIRS